MYCTSYSCVSPCLHQNPGKPGQEIQSSTAELIRGLMQLVPLANLGEISQEAMEVRRTLVMAGFLEADDVVHQKNMSQDVCLIHRGLLYCIVILSDSLVIDYFCPVSLANYQF